MGAARLRRDWSESEELSKRELEVLRCGAEGLSRKATAAKLFLAVETIAAHRSNIFRKLGAKHLAHAVALAYEQGLWEVPDELVFGGVRYVPVKEG